MIRPRNPGAIFVDFFSVWNMKHSAERRRESDMVLSDLCSHYTSQIREANAVCDCDRYIQLAFIDYLADRLTYEEYGKVRFAAIGRISDLMK